MPFRDNQRASSGGTLFLQLAANQAIPDSAVAARITNWIVALDDGPAPPYLNAGSIKVYKAGWYSVQAQGTLQTDANGDGFMELSIATGVVWAWGRSPRAYTLVDPSVLAISMHAHVRITNPDTEQIDFYFGQDSSAAHNLMTDYTYFSALGPLVNA
jgi:hypothetical protein